MDMTDNSEIIIERFIKESAQPAISDDGFTERVMQSLPATSPSARRERLLSRLWTAVCLVSAVVLFVLLDGSTAANQWLQQLLAAALTHLSVLATTRVAPADVLLAPWWPLLWVLLGVVLPYQTYRRLYEAL